MNQDFAPSPIPGRTDLAYATILVNLEAGRSNASLLSAAVEAAKRFEAYVIGNAACTPIQMLYSDGYVGGEVFEDDRAEIDKELAAAEREFHAAMGAGVKVLGWQSAVVTLSLADHLANQAAGADLVLTGGMSTGPFNAARQLRLGDLVMRAGRPVLVVPQGLEAAPEAAPSLDRVLLAWKDTPEARRAASDALPLMARASHVGIVEIAPEDELGAARLRLQDVAAWLARHGIASHTRVILANGDDMWSLDAAAAAQDAGVIVAGAYGHSRLREWALGGVTRSLLQPAARASFLSH